MSAAFVACVVLAGCARKDFNSTTEIGEGTSVSLSNDSTSYHILTGVDSAVAFSPVAALPPQSTAIANGTSNMTYAVGNANIPHLNDDRELQGLSAGATSVTITYTDVDHNFATTTLTVPITVTAAP